MLSAGERDPDAQGVEGCLHLNSETSHSQVTMRHSLKVPSKLRDADKKKFILFALSWKRLTLQMKS